MRRHEKSPMIATLDPFEQARDVLDVTRPLKVRESSAPRSQATTALRVPLRRLRRWLRHRRESAWSCRDLGGAFVAAQRRLHRARPPVAAVTARHGLPRSSRRRAVQVAAAVAQGFMSRRIANSAVRFGAAPWERLERTCRTAPRRQCSRPVAFLTRELRVSEP